MFVLYKKELQRFFNTAMGYIVIAVFLLITGLFLWVFRGEYNILESGYANLDGLFVLAPWLYLFLAPAVTMQLFADEQDKGTIELLYTKPIRKTSIVFGKFLAGFTLMLIALFPTLLWYVSVLLLAEPIGNVDSGAFWGSFIGLVFLAATYVAIGVFASALSKNQLVAFVVAVILCFVFLYGFELVSALFSSGSVADVVERFGINAHYQSMSRGVLDSRDILYFVTLQGLFLLFTHEKIRQ
ncbi:MAG: gliding motility-associated ABC transporter permease subunit GldF [Paludibacteraceae bacterium]|nr:gliding motility-associated ABC transporter permease subunit GldF [Paludibacteraceae bacterium]